LKGEKKMKYAFLIIAEHDGSRLAPVEIIGPSDCKLTAEEIKEKSKTQEARKFRLKDEDGNIYARGYFYGDSMSEDGFAPLDDYGTPNFGATDIEYKVGDNYKVW
jgi:hypothetical protein